MASTLKDESNVPFFTETEINAAIETKLILVNQYGYNESNIPTRELMIVVLNCKLKPEIAAKKYKKWLDGLSTFGLMSFEDIWKNLKFDEMNNSEEWQLINQRLMARYTACGRDKYDRSISWFKPGRVEVAEEIYQIKATVIYYTAIHSDFNTLRNGLTVVLDGRFVKPFTAMVGNEQKLARYYLSMPTCPQHILAVGVNIFLRGIMNSILTVVSMFMSEKISERFRFITFEDLFEHMEMTSLPVQDGGNGDGISNSESMLEWVKLRITNFPPLPNI
eukprot:gene9616-12949_t